MQFLVERVVNVCNHVNNLENDTEVLNEFEKLNSEFDENLSILENDYLNLCLFFISLISF
jgi:hypothetical protein